MTAITDIGSKGIDVKKVREEAEKEVQEERVTIAKKKVKMKLKEIADSELIVRNLKRELEDLYLEISE